MFKADRLIRRGVSLPDMDSVRARQSRLNFKDKDVALLQRCERIWGNMDDFRQQRARGVRFTYGDQWADIITVNGKAMTYRDYLMRQGNVVIQTNQIKNKVDTIVGVMVKDKSEPVCHAIDRDEQQYGEIMTVALQANCEKNLMTELEIKFLKDICIGGLAVAHEAYDDTSGPNRRLDSWTTYCNPNQVFFESEAVDPRFWDVTLVGQFFDKSFAEVCAMFVHKSSDYGVLRDIYSSQSAVFKEEDVREITDRHDESEMTFLRPSDSTKCRVYEVWTRETRARIRLHDTNEGTEEIIDADDREYRRQVKAENDRRRRLARESGWPDADVPYIIGDGYGSDEGERNGFFIDTYWYCRFLAPDGTVLWEGESPYADRSHPFSFCAFPFVDGKITGYMNDAIDHNIAMNRAIVLHDWLLRSQAKGVTVVPKAIVPDDVSFDEFARSWTSIDDMVFIDMKPGQEGLMPKTFFGAAQNFDVSSLIATYARLMDSGTPVNGAIQGKAPGAGTSGALYAQMVTNASTPIAGLMEDFRKFKESILYKKMKNIAMFYDTARFSSIAGRIDGIMDNANINLNEVGDLEYDIKIKESADTPVFRAVINQDAKEFLLNGLISFEEYLEIADVPYADKILQGRQARQAEAEAMSEAGMPVPAGGPPAQGNGHPVRVEQPLTREEAAVVRSMNMYQPS
ncbi:MAG: hypothetical protein IKW99_03385 [Bacteroidales bacterium]|nr:hypothetical protein [Bacteroidales bacterium]